MQLKEYKSEKLWELRHGYCRKVELLINTKKDMKGIENGSKIKINMATLIRTLNKTC